MADDYTLDAQVGHLLRRAYQRAAANLNRRLAGEGLTPVQFAVLARLGQHGAVSQNELGRLAAIDPPTAHGVVRRLRGRGLLDTATADGDRRLRLLSLSPAGRQMLARLIPDAAAAAAETLAPLATDERQHLFDYLRRIAG